MSSLLLNILSNIFSSPSRNVSYEDAEGIFSATKKPFTAKGLVSVLDKMLFLTSSGGSVKTGIKKGLITLNRKDKPWVRFAYHIVLNWLLKTGSKWMDPSSTCF